MKDSSRFSSSSIRVEFNKEDYCSTLLNKCLFFSSFYDFYFFTTGICRHYEILDSSVELFASYGYLFIILDTFPMDF